MTRDVQDPLQALLQRESAIKADILNPRTTEVDPMAFTVQQLGLEYVLVGKDGRFWVRRGDGLRMVFDPKGKQ